MKTAHIVHLSTYPVDDIRIFQKACKSEVAEGYRVTQIVCHECDGFVDGVAIRSVAPSTGRLSRVFGLSWKMYREARRLDADIYQFHHPDLVPAGLLLKLSGKKVIYDTRECYPDKILSMRWIPVKLRHPISAAFALYERITSAVWDHVLVADRYSARAFSGRPVSVVPNYPLLASVKRPEVRQHDKHTLIYVGGLTKERGLLVMLKIAELLRDRNVELQLMGGCFFAEDEERIRAVPNVQYLGNQNLQAVYQRIAEADLGLLLLQPVPAYSYAGENTLKLFEYMWCELPLVSSDFPNLRQIIGGAQCGICIDPCNAERAAAAIMNLLEQPTLRHQMGRNGRDAVLQAYNWPAASKVLSQAYKKVLSNNRSSGEPLPLWIREPVQAVPYSVNGVR
ncbi:glycosyltransferase family 4 protein [Edaphobacter bradus]|uniref:glycosyltransferase family 4 protein n=1 Tax=Edaphobacter bradus TaxID=2259016 RepID=UPI0021DFAA3F|nr:glycosyltransferase family 4 protein [Edaphobacter bradus]